MQMSGEFGVGAQSRLYREYNMTGCVCYSCHCGPPNQLASEQMERIKAGKWWGRGMYTCFPDCGC